MAPNLSKKARVSKTNDGGFLFVSTSKKSTPKSKNSPVKEKSPDSSSGASETPPVSIIEEDVVDIQELEDELDIANERLSLAKDKIRRLERDLEVQTKNTSHWEREYERIMRGYEAMKQLNNQLADKIYQLEEKNGQLTEKIDLLGDKNDTLRLRIGDQDRIITVKDETIRVRDQEVRRAEQGKKEAYGKVAALNEEVDRLRDIKIILSDKLELAQRELDRETYRRARPNPFDRRDFPLR